MEEVLDLLFDRLLMMMMMMMMMMILNDGKKCSEYLFGHVHSVGRVAHISGHAGPPMKHEFGSRMRCMSQTDVTEISRC